jgi:hypothetical protein
MKAGSWPTFTFFCKGGDHKVGCHSFFFADDSQSVGRDQDENPGIGSMSSHLYKERKGGPATTANTFS